MHVMAAITFGANIVLPKATLFINDHSTKETGVYDKVSQN